MKNKKTIAHFQAKYLQVLKPFMAKKDVRFYLNGLQIKPHLEGVLITATDGHRLAAVYDKEGFCEEEIIVPVSDEMFSFSKKKFKLAPRFLIKESEHQKKPKKGAEQSWPKEVVQSLVATRIMLGKKPTATAEIEFNSENPDSKMICFSEYRDLIDAVYPTWQTLIPDVSELSPAANLFSFNAKYLADLDALNAARTDNNKGFGQIHLAVSSGGYERMIAVGGEEDECFSIVMPMRHDDDAVVYPTWLSKKKQYPNAVEILGWRAAEKYPKPKTKKKLHLWLKDGSSCSAGRLFHESACSAFQGANEFTENLGLPPRVNYVEADKITFTDDLCCKHCLAAAKKLQDSIESVPWPSREEIKKKQSDQLLVAYNEKNSKPQKRK